MGNLLSNPSVAGFAAGLAGLSILIAAALGPGLNWVMLLSIFGLVGVLCVACFAFLKWQVDAGRANEQVLPYVVTGVLIVGTLAGSFLLDSVLD
jgi:hypothetical protein